ncbi:putative folylpolyglutamate synthase/dihydrofolate synthase [Gregarina niphandrodes]|uniref:Folylpolyglutamate synthase/dihydrofolate synthase n=1 Tax=Gregarina niphandrodes TaxID=110365 RepID=A0A023BC41_GRENI|nr:putative folylpolyglutamate synthase/dihydrofolate synthase [Gregarina niphandrodes]EZG81338.1 putative folylpolyglutamate synthase/dihydrofolate synthase [Gregarina niphandrodes]|eukprot:XP_011134228.1 putative folylpolyglutamate synthase/dihydrofolate synthase [Gregarina niphandrodes]
MSWKKRRVAGWESGDEYSTTTSLGRRKGPALTVHERLAQRYGVWKELYRLQLEQPDEGERLYRACVQDLEHRRAKETDFERIQTIIRDQFGDPQNTYGNVHVTGTNGKGTVCYKTADLLAANGLSPVGLFTSPHIFSIRERFRVDGEKISRLELLAVVRVIDEVMAEGSERLRFFQTCTLIAFLWFLFKGVRVAVIEVGIGGRLDATNVIERPLCTVITSVDLDHVEYLGPTLSHIAREKAGIFKPNCLAVVGPGIKPEALEAIQNTALSVGASLHCVRREILDDIGYLDANYPEPAEWSHDYEKSGPPRVPPASGTTGPRPLGASQTSPGSGTGGPTPRSLGLGPLGSGAIVKVNGLIAATVAKHVCEKLGRDILSLPLSPVMPPGRAEEALPGVYVDGGHNSAAMRNLAWRLRHTGKPVFLGLALSQRRTLEVFNPLVEILGTRIREVRYLNYKHELQRSDGAIEKDLTMTNVK